MGLTARVSTRVAVQIFGSVLSIIDDDGTRLKIVISDQTVPQRACTVVGGCLFVNPTIVSGSAGTGHRLENNGHAYEAWSITPEIVTEI